APDSAANLTNTLTESRANLTGEGQVFGTVAYMSPEQARGIAVDARSDVFSLGVVLYQMLTGERPFQGASAVDMISSILRDKPASVTDLRADLPPHLGRILRRCLEKDPRDRYQTSRDVFNELKELRAEASSAPVSSPRSEAGGGARPPSGAIRADEGFWVAVLPFKSAGTSTELKALADGLSEEVVAGLSPFSYLRVITGGSTQRYANQSPDLRVVGKELGARYVMNGSLRQVGARLHVAVQLVDATTGAQLWAETFERPFSPEAVFELQDDLVPRIVSTVADMHGVLPRSMSEAVRIKAPDQMSPYEALLRSFGYNERFTPEDHAEVRTCLERAVQQAPGNADCWAMLSLMYANEYGHWGNPGPGSLERALRAARTAVEAAPLSSLPYYALAQALFFRREIPAFRVAAERAVSLNPMDGATAAFMGLLIAYAGDWERGCALSEKGSQLNPNHPGLYRYTAWHDAYRKKDYRGALDVALKLNAPKNFYTHAVLAICYAQLGQMEQARKAVRDLLALKPDYAQVARELHGRWIEPELVEHLMDGLRKAGLEIATEGEAAAPAVERARSSAHVAGAARADEGGKRAAAGAPAAWRRPAWAAAAAAILLGLAVYLVTRSGVMRPIEPHVIRSIAVLPLDNYSGDPNQDYFAEGMTDELTADLATISQLRVISRGSTMQFKGKNRPPTPEIAKRLNVDAIVEGSVRRAGDKVRITAQLIDARADRHLWARSFERNSRDVLALQDELASAIAREIHVQLTPAEQSRLTRA
ncbi:MAG: protein kinase domain-containing protein, partial [Thermoanaerobaculia bacterium]